ncbi:hypothetical protein [Ralstonia phage RSP15]|uniref:hypothetical protein n=1 Tax=Ralstonia phage RSP15 TaxID=1785960 RepID=UPI00074D340A|nr:hypothetical protein BH754_gp160 [Ralstonia phage RSP15]BAU40146.1 hypothetical protein [Ralstonia phage RSP15]
MLIDRKFAIEFKSPESFMVAEKILLEAGYWWWRYQKGIPYAKACGDRNGPHVANRFWLICYPDGEMTWEDYDAWHDEKLWYEIPEDELAEVYTFDWSRLKGSILNEKGEVVFGEPFNQKPKLDGLKIQTTYGKFHGVYDYLVNIGYTRGDKNEFSPTIDNHTVYIYAAPDGKIYYNSSKEMFESHPFQEYEITYTVSMIPKEDKPDVIELDGCVYRKSALLSAIKNLSGVSVTLGV